MKDVNKPIIGRYVKQSGGYKAFTPFFFPPVEFLAVSPSLYKTHEEATRLIGKLDGITRLLPDKDFFLLMFVKKDATYSSQIEGTQATMQDAVVEPVSDDGFKLPPDVDDIIHYINAVNYGTQLIKNLPLSWRYIYEMHAKLMHGARVTQHAYPGEFRKSQKLDWRQKPNRCYFCASGTLRHEPGSW